MYRKIFKRIIDFSAAFIGILMLLPIFMILMIMSLFLNKGRPFFFQERPGKDAHIFKIIKFKSMSDKKDRNGNLLPDAERMTRFGAFLRKSSLDEIPQLINILKGDMSLVGPRPLLIRYLPYYTKEEQIRHTVRPGVTGLAQVSGRNALSWDDKLLKDIEYVKNITLLNDMSILFKTIKKVLQSNDIELDAEMLDLDELRSKKANNI